MRSRLRFFAPLRDPALNQKSSVLSLNRAAATFFSALRACSFRVELSSYLFVGQPTPYDPLYCRAESLCVCSFAIVVAKCLLVKIRK